MGYVLFNVSKNQQEGTSHDLTHLKKIAIAVHSATQNAFKIYDLANHEIVWQIGVKK